MDWEQARVFSWIDGILSRPLPTGAVALCLNLYDDGDGQWSAELVGTNSFDADDPDWACDELFALREQTLCFTWNTTWDEVLAQVIADIKTYLETGPHRDMLKRFRAVAVGFVDGDLETVYLAD